MLSKSLSSVAEQLNVIAVFVDVLASDGELRVMVRENDAEKARELLKDEREEKN